MPLSVLPLGMRRTNDYTRSNPCKVPCEMAHVVDVWPYCSRMQRRCYTPFANAQDFRDHQQYEKQACIYASCPFWRYEWERDSSPWLIFSVGAVFGMKVLLPFTDDAACGNKPTYSSASP